MDLHLRDVIDDDLDVLFELQRDPEANHMAAFTSADPDDRQAFDDHWARIRANDDVHIRVVEVDGEVVGSVLSFLEDGHREVSYWIGRFYWGKGIATEALRQFIADETRPLHARVVQDNVGSLRVLDRCGFVVVGQSSGFAAARHSEVAEWLLRLD